MRILVDNTGIHSVARCLERQAKGEVDVLGLLQFATQLVFCDVVAIGGYESDEVKVRSRRVLEEVVAVGICKEAIEYVEYTEEEWVKGTLRVAKAFAEDFQELFPQDVGNLTATAPDFDNRSVIPDAGVHELIADHHSETELGERAAKALGRRAVGLVEYSLAACPALWGVVRKEYVDRGGWSATTTANLAVLIRVCRNTDAAIETQAHYAPAVARARLLRCHGTLIQERLASLVAEAASKLARCQIRAPSIEQVLTREAKGDPRAVLTEAVKLREKAKPLRAVLRKVTRNLVDGDDDSALVFENQMMGIDDFRTGWGNLFDGKAGFKSFSHQQWVDWVRKNDTQELWKEWLSYIEERYGY